MKVICIKACVTRLDHDVRSLVEGSTYDLPDKMAGRLLDGGYVRREGKRQPEKSERPVAEKTAKKTPAKRAAKRSSRKKLDGAPENKGAGDA